MTEIAEVLGTTRNHPEKTEDVAFKLSEEHFHIFSLLVLLI